MSMELIKQYGSHVANYIDSMKKQDSVSAEREKKVRRQTGQNDTGNQLRNDSVIISEEGRNALKEKMDVRENIALIGELKELPSLNDSRFGIMNDFQKIVSELGGGSVPDDFVSNEYSQESVDALKAMFAEADETGKNTFDSYVNKMASAYQLMKDRIEEKYADPGKQKEYYVAADGSKEELTKEKELEMLDQAYESHSRFMATSTQIWSELQDFKANIVYHSDKGTDKEPAKAPMASKKEPAVKERAYQAFMSAIGKGYQSDSVLNRIWDYYAGRGK